MDRDHPIKKGINYCLWHHTYFKQVTTLLNRQECYFSIMFASHPLHPNLSARSFESPEQSGKIETRTIANGRVRHWPQPSKCPRCFSPLVKQWSKFSWLSPWVSSPRQMLTVWFTKKSAREMEWKHRGVRLSKGTPALQIPWDSYP